MYLARLFARCGAAPELCDDNVWAVLVSAVWVAASKYWVVSSVGCVAVLGS